MGVEAKVGQAEPLWARGGAVAGIRHARHQIACRQVVPSRPGRICRPGCALVPGRRRRRHRADAAPAAADGSMRTGRPNMSDG